MRRLGWLAVIVAVLSLTAWACGGGDDDGGGDDNGDGGNITDACDSGIPGGAPGELTDDVPDAIPDDLPIYDGADFRCGYEGETDGVAGAAGIWTTGDSVDDVKAFYDEEFGGDGPWTSAGSGSAAGSTFWTISNEDGDGAVVTLTSEGDDTVITIVAGDDLNGLPTGDDDDSSSGDDDDSSSGDDDRPVSEPDDPSGEGDDDGSGDADLPDEVDLPDDFPSDDVDLPDGGRVTNASSFTSGGVQSFVIEILSQDSVEDLAAHFKDSFEAKGWAQSFQQETSGLISAAYTENADSTGKIVSLTISESAYDGYNSVALSIVNN